MLRVVASVTVPAYVALLHYPVMNRHGSVVTSAVTNMDIHDISRTVRTYGLSGFYIVTPIMEQHVLVGRILDHWKTGSALKSHPDRVEAVALVQLVKSFAEVKAAIRAKHDQEPEVVLTDAQLLPDSVDYAGMKQELADSARTKPVVFVFGTGWGISEIFYSEVHRILKPIYGPEQAEGYNHLSVRAAVAVILDRLYGE